MTNNLERIHNIKEKLSKSKILNDSFDIENNPDPNVEDSIAWEVTPDMNFPTDTFEDNRKFSLAEMLNYVNTRLELLEDVQEEVCIDPSNNALIRKPVAERRAELEKMKLEFEQMIAKAEAEEPGSSEPPEMEESA